MNSFSLWCLCSALTILAALAFGPIGGPWICLGLIIMALSLTVSVVRNRK